MPATTSTADYKARPKKITEAGEQPRLTNATATRPGSYLCSQSTLFTATRISSHLSIRDPRTHDDTIFHLFPHHAFTAFPVYLKVPQACASSEPVMSACLFVGRVCRAHAHLAPTPTQSSTSPAILLSLPGATMSSSRSTNAELIPRCDSSYFSC